MHTFSVSNVAERTSGTNPIKVVSERSLEEEMDDSLGGIFQAHRLQLFGVEVEDEGHARG